MFERAGLTRAEAVADSFERLGGLPVSAARLTRRAQTLKELACDGNSADDRATAVSR